MLNKVERVLRRGLYSLSDSLFQEWPLPDGDTKNEIAEANLTIHLAHAFLNQDYCAFAENRTGANEHYDLVVFHPDHKEYLIIEAKRFLKQDDSGLNSDFDRLLNRCPLSPAIGCVVCLTREKAIRDWWQDPHRAVAPDGKRSARWEELAGLLQESGSTVGHVPLPHHGDSAAHGSEGFFQEALYAIFHVPKKAR